MHVYTLRCEMVAPIPIAEAFRVFEDPYNLARITPPWLNFRVTSKERVAMRKGAEIDYVIRWMGIPMRWRTLITQYDPPDHFVDEEVKGPYALWRHEHTFEAVPEGTRVRDRVDYALPFGVLGRAAHALTVGAQLVKIFEYRQMKLDELFGVASRKVLAPEIFGGA